ncbi:MAG: SelB C-terminal domain-containing protein [Pseudomonadota bacterium]
MQEISEQDDKKEARRVLRVLINEGVLVKIKENLHYHAQALGEIKARLTAYFAKHDRLGAQRFKGITHLSRKYLMPLLEHFDVTQVTIRVGDERVPRKK